jgi:hypothetical protein
MLRIATGFGWCETWCFSRATDHRHFSMERWPQQPSVRAEAEIICWPHVIVSGHRLVRFRYYEISRRPDWTDSLGGRPTRLRLFALAQGSEAAKRASIRKALHPHTLRHCTTRAPRLRNSAVNQTVRHFSSPSASSPSAPPRSSRSAPAVSLSAARTSSPRRKPMAQALFRRAFRRAFPVRSTTGRAVKRHMIPTRLSRFAEVALIFAPHNGSEYCITALGLPSGPNGVAAPGFDFSSAGFSFAPPFATTSA